MPNVQKSFAGAARSSTKPRVRKVGKTVECQLWYKFTSSVGGLTDVPLRLYVNDGAEPALQVEYLDENGVKSVSGKIALNPGYNTLRCVANTRHVPVTVPAFACRGYGRLTIPEAGVTLKFPVPPASDAVATLRIDYDLRFELAAKAR